MSRKRERSCVPVPLEERDPERAMEGQIVKGAADLVSPQIVVSCLTLERRTVTKEITSVGDSHSAI